MSIGSFINTILDLVYPPSCIACHALLKEEPGQTFCRPCSETLEPVVVPVCVICGSPLESENCGAVPCVLCRSDSPAFQSAFAPLMYGGALATAIIRFKYHGASHLARALAGLMISCVEQRLSSRQWDIMVPVPLHITRLRRRGYNQAFLLARHLARKINLPVNPHLLMRIRDTPPQTGLTRRERRKNMGEAFAVRDKSLQGLRVLLIDDVLTTGATADACAKEMLKAGVKWVEVVSLARHVK